MLRMLLLAVLTSLPVGLHAQSAERGEEGPTAAQKLFEDYFERSLELNPLHATFIGDPRYDDRLTNSLSPEHLAEVLATDQRFLAAARDFDRSKLDAADRLSLEIFIYDLDMAVQGARFKSEWLPINQFSSLPTLMPVLASGKSAQPFATAEDYRRFLGRLRDYVIWSDQAIVNMRHGLSAGMTYPRPLMEKVLPQLSALLVEDPEKSLFFQALENFPESVPGTERKQLEKQYAELIEREITPAYRRLHDFLKDEYLPRARTSVAWSAMPNGTQWYAYLVRLYTTTDLPPARIHALGLAEVARIRSEMEEVKREVGFKGDLAAFFRHLQDDPQFYYDDADALIAGYRALKQDIDARLPKLFSDFPKADYEVRAVEAFRARSAAGASYYPPSADGSRPGVFYVNTFNLKAQPKFGMETLALHEAAPGHHFQIAIQQELEGLPRFRRFGGYVAYQEGWALYAESIGKELGLFTDPYQYYGRLSDEMLRAMRLVVDTGLHTRGWSREQAIRYMLDNSSLAPSDAEAEVERYIAMPGQALGYKVGQLRISELRRRAEARLGERFDVREFHSQVLRDGALPLGVLEAKIERWIASERPR